jgi:CRP-like cAMP-binding protein
MTKDNQMEYYESISKSKLFEGIEKDNIENLLDCLDYTIKKYNKNDFVLHQGQGFNSIGLILTGSVVVTKNDYMGNQNVLSKFNPSDHFAESFAASNLPLTVDVICCDDAAIIFIPIDKITLLCSNNCSYHLTLLHNLIRLISSKNILLTNKINQMSKRTTRDKLMTYLLDTAQAKKSDSFDIPYNRQQLADYLSVDRSAMSTELSKLKDEKYIKFNKNHFEINLKKLHQD